MERNFEGRYEDYHRQSRGSFGLGLLAGGLLGAILYSPFNVSIGDVNGDSLPDIMIESIAYDIKYLQSSNGEYSLDYSEVDRALTLMPY